MIILFEEVDSTFPILAELEIYLPITIRYLILVLFGLTLQSLAGYYISEIYIKQVNYLERAGINIFDSLYSIMPLYIVDGLAMYTWINAMYIISLKLLFRNAQVIPKGWHFAQLYIIINSMPLASVIDGSFFEKQLKFVRHILVI